MYLPLFLNFHGILLNLFKYHEESTILWFANSDHGPELIARHLEHDFYNDNETACVDCASNTFSGQR